MNESNKLESLTLTVIKTILILVISLTITSVILDVNLLDFTIIFLIFMIPVSRSIIMIIEFSKANNQINAVSELAVLGIILGLVTRIII